MKDKVTLATLKKYKQEQHPIAMLTCYDYSTAVLLQEAGVDGIIVGDSLEQVVLGRETTLSATMDIMIALTAAVRRGAPNVYLIGDMPFLSYQISSEQAVSNAGRFLVEAACDAVKLEVDHRYLSLVERLATAGIPVMAHLGHRPQWAAQSDRVVQTRSLPKAQQLIQTGLEMVQAGATAILLECVTAATAQALSERTDIPVISCGSGPGCDGQVLVLHEILGLPGSVGPRFSKTYAQIGDAIRRAASQYAQEIHNKIFPEQQHSYHMPEEDKEKLLKWLENLDQSGTK